MLLGVGHTSIARAADEFHVLVQCTILSLVSRLAPLLATSFEIRLCEIHRIHRAIHRVDLDHVAVLQKTNGTANLRLWRDVTNAEAVRATREAAVSDERDVLPQDPSQQVSALCLQA